jgi:cytochrome c553
MDGMNAFRTLLAATALATALPAVSAVAQDVARGKELFQLCQQCHGENGGGNPVTLAPAIAGLPEWFVEAQILKFQAGGRGTHFDDISGMRMRPMSMWLRDPADVKNVAAHVANLPRVQPARMVAGGNPETGKQKYVPCIACHGANGEGNQALNAPPLAGMSDWYGVTALQKFKAGVRGTNPKDTPGMLMRPMSMTLADDQAIRDVVAYISTFSAKQ